MQFAVLGPPRMTGRGGGSPQEVSGALRRGLLSLLLARADEPVPAEVLLDALWGERPEPRRERRLQLQVHRLRRLLDAPERLEFGPGGYRLRVRPGELDAERFGALLAQAGRRAGADPRGGAELIREALGLWQGTTPYAGVELPALAGEVQRLCERRLLALEELYGAELRSGQEARAAAELAELTRSHPLRERLHGLLVTALYRSGRQADALAAYRRARQTVVAELGLEPGPELRDLEQRILAGEPIGPEGGVPAGPDGGAGGAHPPPVRVVPQQLPHRVPGFTGRDGELGELDRLLAGGGTVLISAVAGTAGVGKTALAVQWAHRARGGFPDGQPYVDLRGYGPGRPAEPGDVLAVFLRALGADGTVVPRDAAERAALYRSLIARKRVLVVLDNARSAEQVRPLLPGAKGCFVLVTSRDTLAGLAARDGAHRIDLDRLTGDEARRLLSGLLDGRCAAEPAATARLVELCARLPLALRIAAERVRESPHRTVADLVAELADEQDRLDLLDAGDPHASVRAAFFASYRHLGPAEARLFRLLGVHPGQDTDVYALAALAGDTRLRETRRGLDRLVRASLVDEVTPGRYRPHDLLRSYAAELAAAEDAPADRTAALARLCDHYLRTAARAADIIAPHELRLPPATDGTPAPRPPADYQDALAWLDTERANLVRTATAAADQQLADRTGGFSTVLLWYLDLGLHLDDAQRLHGRALEAARERGDLAAEGTALRALGLVGFRQDRLQDAVPLLERALDLHIRAGDPLLEAASAGSLGSVLGYLGRTEEAIRRLRRSAELYRELGSRRDLLHRPAMHLGLLLRRQGRPEEAEEALREALDIAQECGQPPGQAHALCGLAAVYRDTGRYDEALAHARRAVAAARTGSFPFTEGFALARLGSVHQRLGDHDSARRRHTEALAIARATYNTGLEMSVLNELATDHAAVGETAEAVRCHTAALAVAAGRGAAYEQARAHAGLGRCHDGRGERERAVGHWRQALGLFRGLRAPQAAAVEARLSEEEWPVKERPVKEQPTEEQPTEEPLMD
ncbi:tetratricopeptide repeat protein [Streptomyces sp. NPDC051940]|uniref:AfsR/SARP family transcriptional regulator n=1 Tax=Streptomyces sp. NPDC051940 TaxID=3155675 RepID=UPI0034135284